MSRSNKRKQVDRTAQHESEGYNEEDMDSDDWKSVKEPHKRRQIQNRLAQRRYRKSSLHLLMFMCSALVVGSSFHTHRVYLDEVCTLSS